jgi:hypothetical protein
VEEVGGGRRKAPLPFECYKSTEDLHSLTRVHELLPPGVNFPPERFIHSV